MSVVLQRSAAAKAKAKARVEAPPIDSSPQRVQPEEGEVEEEAEEVDAAIVDRPPSPSVSRITGRSIEPGAAAVEMHSLVSASASASAEDEWNTTNVQQPPEVVPTAAIAVPVSPASLLASEPGLYMARSVHYPDLRRDDYLHRPSAEGAFSVEGQPPAAPSAVEGEGALEENLSELTIRGFIPSAPSFDEGQRTGLLRDVGRNPSEQWGYQHMQHQQHQHHQQYQQQYQQYQQHPPQQMQMYPHPQAAPMMMMPLMQHQQQQQQQPNFYYPHHQPQQMYPQQLYPPHHHQQPLQPVQHIRQTQSPALIHHPQLHPVTVAAVSASASSASLAMAAAQQERLAYLRAKAMRAEQKEAVEQLAESAPPVVTHITHLVAPGDDLTDLAVRYGTTEANIRALNRAIVFTVLDNVVGRPIRIPATRNFDPTARTSDATTRADEARANQRFHAVRSFQARTKCTESEAEFYLEEHDFDVKEAIAAWEADLDWEKQQKKAKTKGAAAPPAAAATAMRSSKSSSSSSSASSYVPPPVRPAAAAVGGGASSATSASGGAGTGLHRLHR